MSSLWQIILKEVFQNILLKGTFTQIEKPRINDHLNAKSVSSKFRIAATYNFIVFRPYVYTFYTVFFFVVYQSIF